MLLSAACFAQAGPGPIYPSGAVHPIQSVQIFNPPLNSNSSQWTDYQTALTSVLTTGAVGFWNTSCTVNCSGKGILDAGSGTDGADWCPSPSGSVPDAGHGLDNWVTVTTANNNLANIVVAPATYNNNTGTPAGLFGTAGNPGFARKLDTDCSGTKGSNGGIYSLTWAPNHRYLPGQYVFDVGTNAYWQIQTGCAVWTHSPLSYFAVNGVVTMLLDQIGSVVSGQYVTVATTDVRVNAAYVPFTTLGSQIIYTVPGSTYTGTNDANFQGDATGDAGCISGNSLTFSGTTTSDGTAPNTFTWVKLADAPYQDSWVGSAYQGLANKAYSITLSTGAGAQSCNASTCTATLSNPYIGTANSDRLTIAGATGFTRMNCGGCLVTAIGATTVTYNNPGANSGTGTVSAGTMTASRNLNMGMTNATIAVVQSGLPIPYEPPAFVANTYYGQWVFNHLALNAHVGYIGIGGAIGGEDNTVGLTLANGGWRYGSESQYLAYQYLRYGLFHTYAKAANILLRGNIFNFTFQQAYFDWLFSASLGTNGYQMNDALAILAGHCNNVGAVQADWCLLFNEYYNQPYPDWYGTFPMLELQFGSQLNGGQGTSTPGLDNAGNTGSLGPDPPPGGNPNCIGCPFVGLLPLAKANHATDMEVYDAIDQFLAVDPNYPAGGFITNGNVDVTTGVVTAHAGTSLTFASIANGNLAVIAGTTCTVAAPCTISNVTGSSFNVPASVTGVSNAVVRTFASAALYQLSYAAAFGAFINFGYQISGAGSGTFTIGGQNSRPPADYSALRTDLAVAPVGGVISVPPKVGPNTCTAGSLSSCGNLTGINTKFTDPDFGTTVVRASDSQSVPGKFMQSGDSGRNSVFNCGGTSACGGSGPDYIVLKTNGNVQYVEQFNPATMQVGAVFAQINASLTKLSWANTNRYRLYSISGTGTVVNRLDFTPGTLAFSTNAYFDFNTPSCLGNSVNGSSGTYTATWNGIFEQDASDDMFVEAFSNAGVQETGFHVAAYKVSTGECWVYNTQTGTVAYNGTLLGTVNTASRFLLHEGNTTRTANYAVLTPSGSCISGPCGNQTIWQIGTLNVTPCSAQCGGEFEAGFAQVENGDGVGNWNQHQFSSFGTSTGKLIQPANVPVPNATCIGVQHSSWHNDDALDSQPLIVSYGTAPTCTAFTAAWQKEVIVIPQNGGPVGRAAHNFATGANAASFDASSAIAQVSPDGRFVAFTSDWLNTLGSTTGAASCTPGTNCAAAVFIVKAGN